MSNAVEIAARFRTFLSSQSLPADRHALAEAAIEAFLAFDARQDPATLGPLFAAARAPYKAVFEIGAQLLAALAGPFETAQQAWLRLANDKSGTARFHAMAYLDAQMPEGLCVKVLRLGLEDKSAKVRSMAVTVVGRLDLKAMLPELEMLRLRETDPGVVSTLDEELPILRDGYRVVPIPGRHNEYWIHFRRPNSSVSAPLFGEPTPEAIRAVIEGIDRRRV